jgi:hypothetical protein
MATRFSDAVLRVLEGAGWYPGRHVDPLVVGWRAELDDRGGFVMFPAAEGALLEFGGIAVRQSGAGVECARESFDLVPTLAVGEEDRFAEAEARVDAKLYPLGEYASGHYFIAIAVNGSMFLVMDDIWKLSDDVDSGIEALIVGKQGARTKL